MQEMSDKKETLPKPSSPPPRRLRNHHYTAAYMSVAGSKPEQIAKEIGLSSEYVRQLLGRADIIALCEKIHWQMFGKDIKRRLENILPKAIDVNEKLMLNELVKPSIRKDIASDFMDRSLGKPIQPLNVQTSSVRELLLAIKERDAKKVIDSSGVQAKNEDINAEYSEIKDVSPSSDDIGDVEKWVQDNFRGNK